MPGILASVDRNSARLYSSPMTVAEASPKGRRLGRASESGASLPNGWTLLYLYAAGAVDRCGDGPAYRCPGRQGQAAGIADLAAAERQGYIVLTRKLRHFSTVRVSAFTLFEMLPKDVP